MILDGLGADFEDQSDGLCGLSFSDELQDFALSVGQFFERASLMSDVLERQLFDQAVGNLAREVYLACRNAPQRAGQLGGSGFLKQVARSASFEGLPEVLLVLVHGENDYPNVREFLSNARSCLETIEAAHGDIHENHVRVMLLYEFNGFASVTGLASDGHIRDFLEFGTNARTHNRMIIRQHDNERR